MQAVREMRYFKTLPRRRVGHGYMCYEEFPKATLKRKFSLLDKTDGH